MGERDWTELGGRANSSPEYLALCDEVARLIHSGAHALLHGHADVVARLIMSQLAHVHGLTPAPSDAQRRVVEAARAWDAIGKRKALHILTCAECERLEADEDRWCDTAAAIGREQIAAGREIKESLAALDGPGAAGGGA